MAIEIMKLLFLFFCLGEMMSKRVVNEDFVRHAMQSLANGKTLRQVCEQHGIKVNTGKHFISSRRKKMGYKTNYEMLASYVHEGMVVIDRKAFF